MSFHVRIRLASELYAMPVEHVVEVAKIGDVVPVPGARPELLGIRNLRDQILPVVDLAMVLGVSRTSPPAHLVVVDSADAAKRRAGFAIDEVTEVGDLPEPGEETESALLRGAALAGDDLIGVIDVSKIFGVLAVDG